MDEVTDRTAPLFRIGWISAACWPLAYLATLYLLPSSPVIVIATVAALAGGALIHASWPESYVTLRFTEDGFVAADPGAGAEREAGWTAVTRTSVTARRTGTQNRGGYTYVGFVIEVDDQWSVRISKTSRFAHLLDVVNTRTSHLPYEWVHARIGGDREILERVADYIRVPRAGVPTRAARTLPSSATRRAGDVTISSAPPHRGRRSRNRLILLVAATGAVALVAPDDPAVRAGVIALPAVFLVPLLVYAIYGDYLTAHFTLASVGDTFRVTKHWLNREHQGDHAWSDVVSTTSSGGRFVVQLLDGTRLRLPTTGPVVAFFNGRAPLDYEWVSAADVKDREMIEIGQDRFAKVRKLV